MYHPSNGLPRTNNMWGYVAVHEKQEANTAATASHGELPRLPSREGRKKQKPKGRKNQKGDQTLRYLEVVKPVTPGEDVPLRGLSGEVLKNMKTESDRKLLIIYLPNVVARDSTVCPA
ncbi:hypothetical protein AVEN_53194-1 [Araneus ventricosus]|uniref:Uncharacterized protein n=1 Tax=Araneus ventricosus TaxID=182803 RepID=A0A4Y2A9G4_ARAVE|nr:hypothetical protein AVEN_53194-1 [Araneus ventricosus]